MPFGFCGRDAALRYQRGEADELDVHIACLLDRACGVESDPYDAMAWAAGREILRCELLYPCVGWLMWWSLVLLAAPLWLVIYVVLNVRSIVLIVYRYVLPFVLPVAVFLQYDSQVAVWTVFAVALFAIIRNACGISRLLHVVSLLLCLAIMADVHLLHVVHTPRETYTGYWKSDDGKYTAKMELDTAFTIRSNLPMPSSAKKAFVYFDYRGFHVSEKRSSDDRTVIIADGGTLTVLPCGGKPPIILHRQK